MANGALVSVKVNTPLAEGMMGGNGVQITTGIRLVVHSTWNMSLVGAVQWRVTLVAVTLTLLMDGNGGTTNTVKLLVALRGGNPLSVTTVVNLNSPPALVGSGVQVMMPLVF